ncbi:MAG: DUF1501 domain-containing protein [Candidatus Kapabacteria bacterium]|nr:DUF1501 domain-containing protein [Candidatus Kapabacteria bacterium]MDW8012259.1 DUF1501 domain-containing protein [Bacteroidota bacterium]
MDRRDFLAYSAKAGILLSALPALGRFPAQALAYSPAMDRLRRLTEHNDRVFVLIQLQGGNDGLNTLVPIENPRYYALRPTLAIPKSQTLRLTDTLGWHPVLGGLKALYDRGELAIVQGVIYPNPDRSHFRGTDIWVTATDADVFLGTGWLGRYLETLVEDLPLGEIPPEPLAVQIGGASSLVLQSERGLMGVSFRNPREFYRLLAASSDGGFGGPLPETPAGQELLFLRSVARAAQRYAVSVRRAAERGTNRVTYPDTDLAQKLRIVAQLISGGLGAKVYVVGIERNAFDTHAYQGGVSGVHASLLKELSDALKAFMDDLKALGIADRVAGMTFSEFGRRVEENATAGTDHGTAAPMFIFGTRVLGGRIHGQDPDLENLDPRGDLLMQYDYRQVYAAALLQWFGAPQTQVQRVLLREFSPLPLFHPPEVVGIGEPWEFGLEAYPNPASQTATISFNLPEAAPVEVALLDIHGRVVRPLLQTELAAGYHRLPVNLGGLPSGLYLYRLRVGQRSVLRALHVVR